MVGQQGTEDLIKSSHPRSIAPSDFEAENSSLNCFLNASHPLRVRVPVLFKKIKSTL